MKNILRIAGGLILGILAIDALGFMLWVVSGQNPTDDFYIGTITAHILRTIIN